MNFAFLFFLFIPWLSVSLGYAGEPAPREKAALIVHGRVVGTGFESAGQLIPISKTRFLVETVFKDIEGETKAGDTVIILTYGHVTEETVTQLSEEEAIAFEEGSEKILFLQKHAIYYRPIRDSPLWGIKHVEDGRVYDYSPAGLTLEGKDPRQVFISRQHKKWKALSELRQKRTGEPPSIPLNRYLDGLEDDMENLPLALADGSVIVAKVKVTGKDEEELNGFEYTNIRFKVLDVVKGAVNRSFSLKFPKETELEKYGYIIKEAGDVGVIFLESTGKVFPSPDHFIKIDIKGGKVFVGELPYREFKLLARGK